MPLMPSISLEVAEWLRLISTVASPCGEPTPLEFVDIWQSHVTWKKVVVFGGDVSNHLHLCHVYRLQAIQVEDCARRLTER